MIVRVSAVTVNNSPVQDYSYSAYLLMKRLQDHTELVDSLTEYSHTFLKPYVSHMINGIRG